MMHNLILAKRPTQYFLRNKNVFKNVHTAVRPRVLATNVYQHVSASADNSSLPGVMELSLSGGLVRAIRMLRLHLA